MAKLDGYRGLPPSCGGWRIPCPCSMLTAKGQVEDRVTGLDAARMIILVKPFSTEDCSRRCGVAAALAQAGTRAREVEAGPRWKFDLGNGGAGESRFIDGETSFPCCG